MKRDRGFSIVSLTSLSVAIFIFYFGYFTWPGDAHTYINYAFYMINEGFDPNLYWRTPGYPIIIILAGVIHSGNVLELVAFQCLSAAFIPISIHWAFYYINREISMYCSILTAFSFVPFQYSLMIYPDQLYMTSLVILAALLIRQVTGRARRWEIWVLAGVCIVLASLRPVGLALSVVAFGVAIWRVKPWWKAALPVAVAAISWFGISTFQATTFQNAPSMLGRQVFLNAYMSGDGMADLKHLRSEVAEAVRVAVQEKGADLQRSGPFVPDEYYQDLYAPYIDDASELTEAMLSNPNISYYWTMFSIADISNNELDRIYLLASLNELFSNPDDILFSGIQRYISMVAGEPWRYTVWGRHPEAVFFGPAVPAHSAFSSSNIPLERDLFDHTREPSRVAQLSNTWFQRLYFPALSTSYLLMILGLLSVKRLSHSERYAALTVFLVHTINVGALAVLVSPQFRYQVQTVPLAIMGAVIGVCALRRWLSEIRKQPVALSS